jgi:hypothetical protein
MVMNRKSERPRHRRRSRDDESTRDSGELKEKIDREFEREIEMRIGYFLQSDEQELHLEAMNSYRRRVVHNIAKNFNLQSESRGADRERHVALIKTETTKAPPARKARLWDYGSMSFPVNPGDKGIRIALKVDGSVELWREEEKGQIVAERLVTANQFRIRQGKILQPGEPGY